MAGVWTVWAGGKEASEMIDWRHCGLQMSVIISIAYLVVVTWVLLTLQANKNISVQLNPFFSSDFRAFVSKKKALWICVKGHHLLTLVSFLNQTSVENRRKQNILKNVGSWTVFSSLQRKKTWHFSKCLLLCFIKIHCLKTSLNILSCVAQVNLSCFKDCYLWLF